MLAFLAGCYFHDPKQFYWLQVRTVADAARARNVRAWRGLSLTPLHPVPLPLLPLPAPQIMSLGMVVLCFLLYTRFALGEGCGRRGREGWAPLPAS